MYVGFELNDYCCLSAVSNARIEEFNQQTKGCYKNLSNYLIGAFESKEVIDAEKIARHIFPFKKADIFLSHSHSDEKKAIELAVSLKDKGLSVFVDSCVWGNFDKLLDDLNNVYAEPKRKDGIINYNYRKATNLTAGVHMMLSGALNQMIERSELFIFLNTNKSIPIQDYQSFDRTFSPWIYSELQFSSFVRQITPARKLRVATESYDSVGHLIKSTAGTRTDLVLAFKAFNRHLPKVTGEDLKSWYNVLETLIIDPEITTAEAALDALYEVEDLPRRFEELRYKARSNDIIK